MERANPAPKAKNLRMHTEQGGYSVLIHGVFELLSSVHMTLQA